MILVRWLSYLPFWFWYGVADIIYFLAYRVFGYRQAVVADNIKKAFPEKSEEEIKQIIKGFYHNLADIMVESVKAFTITEKEFVKRVHMDDQVGMNTYGQEQGGYIVVASHQANWEWGQLSCSLQCHDIAFLGIYKKLKNKSIGEAMLKMRSKFGTVPVELEDTVKVIRDHKGPIIVGLIADQSPQVRKNDLRLPFFGREVPFYKGPMQLARLFQYGVVYVDVKRLKRGHYQVTATELAQPPYTDTEQEVMVPYVKKLESVIRERPQEYLWSHRRWKHATVNVDNTAQAN